MRDSIRYSILLFGILALAFSGCQSGSSSTDEPATNAVQSSESDQGGSDASGDDAGFNPGWFKGDLHAHSLYSDGDTPAPDVVAIAEEKGFDYFVLTDHETTGAWFDPGYISHKLTLLYGVEWSAGGHANIWSNKPFDWDAFLPSLENDGDAKLAIQIAHAQNTSDQIVLFSINHPVANLFCEGCVWNHSFEDSAAADGMEVWNARYLVPNQNAAALNETYASYLDQGKKITLVGGSDCHTHQPTRIETLYNDIGHPTTWIYADSKNGIDLLTGLKQGHAYISTSPAGPLVDFKADSHYNPQEPAKVAYDLMMGDTIPERAYGKEVYFMVHVSEATVFSGIVVVKNGLPFKSTLSFSADYCFAFTDKPQKGDYYRVEVRQLTPNDPTNPIGEILQGPMAALTNPIYAW